MCFWLFFLIAIWFILVSSSWQCFSKRGHIFLDKWMFTDISHVERTWQVQWQNQLDTTLHSSIPKVCQFSKYNILIIKKVWFCRLTGTYAFVIFFIATVYRHMEFGPQNVQSEVWSKFCREDPWTNLLYINNFNLKDVTTEVQIWSIWEKLSL